MLVAYVGPILSQLCLGPSCPFWPRPDLSRPVLDWPALSQPIPPRPGPIVSQRFISQPIRAHPLPLRPIVSPSVLSRPVLALHPPTHHTPSRHWSIAVLTEPFSNHVVTSYSIEPSLYITLVVTKSHQMLTVYKNKMAACFISLKESSKNKPAPRLMAAHPLTHPRPAERRIETISISP